MSIARSQPSLIPQWRVTLVTVTLYTENITDREAVTVLRAQPPDVRAWRGVIRKAGQLDPAESYRVPAQDWEFGELNSSFCLL